MNTRVTSGEDYHFYIQNRHYAHKTHPNTYTPYCQINTHRYIQLHYTIIACHCHCFPSFQKRANRSHDDKLLGGLNSGAEGLVVASYFDETISPYTSIIEPTFEGSTERDCKPKETQDNRRKAEKVDGMKYQFVLPCQPVNYTDMCATPCS